MLVTYSVEASAKIYVLRAEVLWRSGQKNAEQNTQRLLFKGANAR